MGLITYLLENYDYYAKPEGQDPMGKIIGLGTHGLVTGLFIGITDATLKSHVIAVHKPVHIPSFLNCMGYWMVPLTGMCVAYSTVTYIATNVRNKRDHFNLILGGLKFLSSISHYCYIIYFMIQDRSFGSHKYIFFFYF